MRPNRRPLALAGASLVCFVVAGLIPSALASTSAAPGSEPVRVTKNAEQMLDSVFIKEARPPHGVERAIALANADPNVDPVKFDRAALAKALAAGRAGGRTWVQVGKGGHIVNSQDYAIDEGRLPTTGIVLSVAADPSDKAGDTVYIGTGGGVWKTTNGGSSWRFMDIPAVPVAAVGLDPVHPKNVYAATGQGFQGGGEYGGIGLYYSHDAGQTWHASQTSIRGGGQEVSVSPKDGTVFAATTGGLFRSTDRGVTFTNTKLPTNVAGTAPYTGSPVGSWTSDVKVRPGHPNEVYAAVGYVAGNVLRSDGTHAAPGNGLYKSTKFGKPGTFKRMDVSSPVTGWLQEPTHSADPIGRTRLAFTANGSHLFALVADAGHRVAGAAGPIDPALVLGVPHPTSLNGVYRSADNGKTWNLIADSASLTTTIGSVQPVLSIANLLGYNAGIQAWYNGWIAVDPNNNRLLVGEEEVYQSVKDATGLPALTLPGPQPEPFTSIDAYVSMCGLATNGSCPEGIPYIGGQVTHPDQHGVAVVDLGSKTRVWIGNDGGIFRQNHGAGAALENGQWTTGAHLNMLLPYRAVEGSDGSVVAGLQDNGTVLWPAKSKNSYEICGGDGTWVAINPQHPKVFYCNANGSTSVTADGGRSTRDIGAPEFPTFAPAASAMDPLDPKHIVLAGGSVVETHEGGGTTSSDWKTVHGLGESKSGARVAEALDVRGKSIYVASCAFCASSVIGKIEELDRNLQTNVGGKWHSAKLIGMHDREITAIAIDPNNSKKVYLATQVPSVIRVAFGGANAARMLVSTDAGNHVKDISGNLPRGNVYDVKVWHKKVYAATDYGVFVAKQGSTSWHRLGKGMPVVRIYGLNLSADHHDLVAATYGLGVWLYPLEAGPTTHENPPADNGGSGGGSSGGGGTNASGPVPAATGLSSGVAVVGLILLAGAIGLARRQRAGVTAR